MGRPPGPRLRASATSSGMCRRRRRATVGFARQAARTTINSWCRGRSRPVPSATMDLPLWLRADGTATGSLRRTYLPAPERPSIGSPEQECHEPDDTRKQWNGADPCRVASGPIRRHDPYRLTDCGRIGRVGVAQGAQDKHRPTDRDRLLSIRSLASYTRRHAGCRRRIAKVASDGHPPPGELSLEVTAARSR
jgi:hypothetical protein